MKQVPFLSPVLLVFCVYCSEMCSPAAWRSPGAQRADPASPDVLCDAEGRERLFAKDQTVTRQLTQSQAVTIPGRWSDPPPAFIPRTGWEAARNEASLCRIGPAARSAANCNSPGGPLGRSRRPPRPPLGIGRLPSLWIPFSPNRTLPHAREVQPRRLPASNLVCSVGRAIRCFT